MTMLLTQEIMSFVGKKSEPKRELVTRRDIRKYAIATGNRQEKYLRGDVAPPMFHIPLFWEVVPIEELEPDGVFIDKLLPEFPLKRQMAGGLKIDYIKDLSPGDWLTATRTLTAVYEKKGRSGPLIFYEIITDIKNDLSELVITEKITRILR